MAPIVASPLISAPFPNLFLESDEKTFSMDGLIKYNATFSSSTPRTTNTYNTSIQIYEWPNVYKQLKL